MIQRPVADTDSKQDHRVFDSSLATFSIMTGESDRERTELITAKRETGVA